MKTVINLLIIIGFCSFAGNAQQVFIVDDFSDQYFGKIFVRNPSEVFSPGWIAIFDKKTNKQLIKIESEELTHAVEDGNIVSNIKEIPYGKQSSILYEDYNFDGKKDLALMDGQKSCYHLPSFQIFLSTGKSFKRSPSFTRLAQEYCGMFDVDHKNKKIHTMTKSSCCWHQYSDFVVQHGKPVATRIIEEGLSMNGLTMDIVEMNRVGGKMKAREYSVFYKNSSRGTTFFSFEFSNKKKMRLINAGGQLVYVFTDKEDRIELLYDGPFVFSAAKDSVAFTKSKTKYEISESGIRVKSSRLDRNMHSVKESITGSFDEWQGLKFENVSYH